MTENSHTTKDFAALCQHYRQQIDVFRENTSEDDDAFDRIAAETFGNTFDEILRAPIRNARGRRSRPGPRDRASHRRVLKEMVAPIVGRIADFIKSERPSHART